MQINKTELKYKVKKTVQMWGYRAGTHQELMDILRRRSIVKTPRLYQVRAKRVEVGVYCALF